MHHVFFLYNFIYSGLDNAKNILKVELKINIRMKSNTLTIEKEKRKKLQLSGYIYTIQIVYFCTRIQDINAADNSACSRSKLSKLF